MVDSLLNMVDSLPLTRDDLCDTWKVIFSGARPLDRIHLKKVLTVLKEKIIHALQGLKKQYILSKSQYRSPKY